jgi:excinuclease ABC subunit A
MKHIVITGARQHNLKNVSLSLPHQQLIVITGVSGSGKSSLAFDTLFAEGQRRYLESLSTHARQFLQQLDRPQVDSIDGLCPAIAIEQKPLPKNPRSTVGTVTEIYDFLRVLYARLGTVHCSRCGHLVRAHTIAQMVDELLVWPEASRLWILAPQGTVEAARLKRLLNAIARDGYVRVRIDGRITPLEDLSKLPRQEAYAVDVVVDRLILNHAKTQRLAESLELGTHRGQGLVAVLQEGGDEKLFTEKQRCLHCGQEATALSLGLFSFNHPAGACPQCKGLGVIAEPESQERRDLPPDTTPFGESREASIPIPRADARCPSCQGGRLNQQAQAITFGGLAIHQVCALPVTAVMQWIEDLTLSVTQREIASRASDEIARRLKTLAELGLSYLSLDRSANTLSGGESQRIRLTHQISSQLSGVLYVLDEPSIGLHPRDHARLLLIMKRLRDAGNTIVVVEHDASTIRQADYVVDMGPGAGELGGEIIYAGSPEGLLDDPSSSTGQYLSGRVRLPLPKERRGADSGWLHLLGARGHNLKNVNVAFPLGAISCVSGVSGSGKSTLVLQTLYPALAQRLHRASTSALPYDRIEGADGLQRVAHIDQSLLDRTPRSNAATYTGTFALIRQLFAQIPEARARGYRANRFSFNVKGGRCEACKGDGVQRIEMYFLPPVSVLCPVCQGARFRRETLEVQFKGHSIADVLNMTIQQAYSFFENLPEIRRRLNVLQEVGLGYLRLGQPATQISGGEAQRIKLGRELGRRESGSTLYILDEPTTGLHLADIHRLLHVLQRLAERGNTVIIIEHHLQVIKAADYVVDLGPDGGEKGGWVVACGTPEDIARIEDSITGQYLRAQLQRGDDAPGAGS